MCSNISTDTTRSKRWSMSKTFMSAVTIETFDRPRSRAAASMNARWLAEFETATIGQRG